MAKAAISESRGAVQVSSRLGSPSAATTIDGKQLPAPAPKFGGVAPGTIGSDTT